VEGEALGYDVVGGIDGTMDAVGCGLGLAEGDADGNSEGAFDGALLGSDEGFSLGAPVLGLADGAIVVVGMLLVLGIQEGVSVGAIGTLVGLMLR
jgi:hypothetical protein